MSGTVAWPLVGRDEELVLLGATLGADAASSLVVAGPAGVGKSRLAADFVAERAAAGWATQVVRATRSTATIPFGAFAPWIPLDDGAAVADRLHVLRSVVAALVDGQDSVVVSIDDAHLLDDGSAALVLQLVTDERVSVLATVRSGEPCPDAVTALWKDDLAVRVDLQPLSQVETATLLERVLGGTLDPAAHRRIWTLTQGLPLYVREVVRAARDQGVLAVASERWAWHGSLVGSDRLLELIGDRLAHAGDDERRLVELVAFGEPLPLALVDELGARALVTEAEQRGLVEVEGAVDAAPGVRLAHPLYTEVVRNQVPAARARDHRSALVTAALAIGWQHRDPLLVAEWALDSDVTLEVDDAIAAARRALALAEWSLAERLSAAAGTGDDAAAVLTRAVALAPQVRWDQEVLDLATRALASLGEDVEPRVAGDAARINAWMLFFTPGPAVTVDEVVAATNRLPAPIRPLAFAHCGFQALLMARPDDALLLAARASPRSALPPAELAEVAAAGELDDLDVQALAVAAFAHGLQGRADAALACASAGLPHVAGILAADPVPGNPAGAMPVAFCLALVLAGRVGEAEAIGSMLHGSADDASRALRALAGALASRMALFGGHLDVARDRADEALAICLETGQLPASHWPAAVLANAAAQSGRAEVGERVLDAAEAASGIPPLYALETRLARGWLQAARGRTSAAQSEAVSTAELADGAGLAGYALFALHDLARFGAASDAAARIAARTGDCEGPYVAALIDHVGALARHDASALAEVSRRFEAMGAVLLAAEAAASSAAAHAAEGRQGSASTERGRAGVLAASCGDPVTPALRDLVDDPVLDTLTAREREVTELAARGLTNREIGEQLYVSVRTVNTHLHRAYAKLGVNDRVQLGPLLGLDPPA